MPIFKLFLSPQVDVPDKVLDDAGKRLKQYFDAICRAMNPQKFSNSTVKISPHSADVADGDLVVYITQSSSILNLMDHVFDLECNISCLPLMGVEARRRCRTDVCSPKSIGLAG